MALQAKDYPEGAPVYSYVADDGVNVHIDSDKLRQWCAEHRFELEVLHTPVDGNVARNYLTENVVDLGHLVRVLAMTRLDPIIYGKWGTLTKGRPDAILIDGHHRYCAAAIRYEAFIPSYVLERAQWEPFQIEGLPNVTQDQLRAQPTAKSTHRR